MTESFSSSCCTLQNISKTFPKFQGNFRRINSQGFELKAVLNCRWEAIDKGCSFIITRLSLPIISCDKYCKEIKINFQPQQEVKSSINKASIRCIGPEEAVSNSAIEKQLMSLSFSSKKSEKNVTWFLCLQIWHRILNGSWCLALFPVVDFTKEKMEIGHLGGMLHEKFVLKWSLPQQI